MTIKHIVIERRGFVILDYRKFITNEKWKFFDQELYETSIYPSAGLLVDIDNNGFNEYILSFIIYPFRKIPIAIFGLRDGPVDLTGNYFPSGAPTAGHPSFIHFSDINADGRRDVVVSEAGLDYPPWTGSRIGVAIAEGLVFRNISDVIPNTDSRAYAVGIADFNGDGATEILIPGQGSNKIEDSYILKISGANISVATNPLISYIENRLNSHTAIVTADFNGDGADDLLFSGAWVDRNNRIIYGSRLGFESSLINVLPPGPLGEGAFLYYNNLAITRVPEEIHAGPEVYSIVLDIDNDSQLDIFSIGIQQTSYPPGIYSGNGVGTVNDVAKDGGFVIGPTSFWAIRNVDGHRFIPKITADHNLGDIYYRYAFPFDINSDGAQDVIGHYWTIDNPKLYGTTFFVNDGSGRFGVLDAAKTFPDLVVSRGGGLPKDIGWLVPTRAVPNKFEGLQILKDEDNNGLFWAHHFVADGTSSLNYPTITGPQVILDRKMSRFIEGSVGKDEFINKNTFYSNNLPKIRFEIVFELIKKGVEEIPNFSFAVNDVIIVDRRPIIADKNQQFIQLIELDRSEQIKTISFNFDSLKYVDQSRLSYVIIRKLTCLDTEVSFLSANFSNGFAFDQKVAQVNGDGTILFDKFDFSEINKKALNIFNNSFDILDGGGNIDISAYDDISSSFSLSSGDARTFKVFKNKMTNDLLTNIERIKFLDKSIAIDLDGNAGNAARLLATVFGNSALKNPAYAGIAISLFDQGLSKEQVSEMALAAVFGAHPKSVDVVKLLWKNLTGTEVDVANLDSLSALIDSKLITAAQLVNKAAELDLTAQLIDLVGLSQTGWEYIPYGG